MNNIKRKQRNQHENMQTKHEDIEKNMKTTSDTSPHEKQIKNKWTNKNKKHEKNMKNGKKQKKQKKRKKKWKPNEDDMNKKYGVKKQMKKTWKKCKWKWKTNVNTNDNKLIFKFPVCSWKKIS